MSSNYNGVNSKLEWKCKYNHTWFAVPCSIKRGVWCPKCNDPNKINIIDIKLYLNEIKDKEENLFYKRVLVKAIEELSKNNE